MKLTAADRRMYEEFKAEFRVCWACKMKPLPSAFHRGNWDWLTKRLDAHHIVGGSGRNHERKLIVSLCKIHHGTYHGDRYRPTKDTTPIEPLTLGEICWLKKRFDPDHFDIERIMELRIKRFEVIELESMEVEK